MKPPMKPLFNLLTLAVLLGSTASAFALTAVEPQPYVTAVSTLSDDARIWLIDSDDDDEDDDDDDDHDEDDDDCEDDDDDCGGHGARNPAKSGTVAPPQNGLFGNGQAPKVITN